MRMKGALARKTGLNPALRAFVYRGCVQAVLFIA